jgi:AcrR family transcriptional regulator
MPKLASATKLERRRQLIEAARRCVAVGGFASITVDDVCAEAGVSKGAFYVYFDGKQDLLIALLEDEEAEVLSMMRTLADAPIDHVDRLRRFARAMVRRGEDPSALQIRADLWAEVNANPTVRERWATVVRERRALLRGWVEEAVRGGELRPIPANALAAILLALADGLMLHAALDPSGFRWTNVSKALDAILDGIRGAA